MARADFRNATVGVAVVLPDIPLFVPEQARMALAMLTVNTMRLGLQHAAGTISDEAPRDQGHLAQSFGADPANTTGGLEMIGEMTHGGLGLIGRVFSALPQAIVMNDGRRPGAPISRAGIDAIGLWARRKLGLSQLQAEDAKWAIANAIITRGIKGTGYFEKGVKAAEPTISQMFAALSGEIALQLTKPRTSDLRRGSKSKGKVQ